jgi:hypothetical protein
MHRGTVMKCISSTRAGRGAAANRTIRRAVAGAVVVAGAALTATACGPSAGTHLECVQGTFQCVCFTNNTCNTGMNCVQDRCVLPDSSSSSVGGTTGTTSGSTSGGGTTSTATLTISGTTTTVIIVESSGSTSTGSTSTATTSTASTTTTSRTSTTTSTTSTTASTSCGASITSGALAASNAYIGVVANGGFAYAYSDGVQSSACVDSTAFCGGGITGVGDSLGTVWGAGIGMNLNQVNQMGAAVNPYPIPVGTTGISYAVSSIPLTQGMRLAVDADGSEYCAIVSFSSGTVPWTSFNSKCWSPTLGVYLAGAPQTSQHIQFQAPAATTSASFSFCVTSLGFY